MHIENLFFFLLVGAAFLLKWLSQRSKDDDQTTKRPSVPDDNSISRGEQTDEERIRQFLEALGQPTSAKPPPKVIRRPMPEVRRVFPRVPPIVEPRLEKKPYPTLTTVPPAEVTAMPSPPLIAPPPASAPPVARAAIFASETSAYEVRSSAAVPASIDPTITKETRPMLPALGAFLRSSDGLRQAVILREVFGPPRSLQALDLLRSV
jgi:hypothetical protein